MDIDSDGDNSAIDGGDDKRQSAVPNTDSMVVDTEHSTPRAFKALKLLPESTLPDKDQVKAAIQYALAWYGEPLSPSNPDPMARLIHSLSLRLPQHMKQMLLPADVRTALEVYDPRELRVLWERCVKNDDLSELMRIPELCFAQSVLPTSTPRDRPKDQEQGVIRAWKSDFVGNAPEVMRKNLNIMYSQSGPNTVPVIQSSGSGKSRMLDELSKTVFTIPINVRDDNSLFAYPPPDVDVVAFFKTHGESLQDVHMFLAAAFETAEAKLQAPEFSVEFADPSQVAKAWWDHLQEGNNRNAYWKEVVDKTMIQIQSRPTPPPPADEANEEREATKTVLQKLRSHLQSLARFQSRCIEVLIYVDEASALTVNTHSAQKNRLDYLMSAFTDLRHKRLFAVLLSTESQISRLAPPARYAASERLKDLAPHAPITETPFDCFPELIKPSLVTLNDLDDIVYISLFGRPLWRAYTGPYWEHVLARVTGKPSEDEMPVDDAREYACEQAIEVARDKLTHGAGGNDARTAVVDCRVLLSFRPPHTFTERNTADIERTLVASHMRTIFSFSSDPLTFCSGYPSEPILAEAAARQLAIWHKSSPHMHPMLSTLVKSFEHDLLDRGEVGEVIARAILLLGRDRAAVAAADDAAQQGSAVIYSQAVPLVGFLEALLGAKAAAAVLDAFPANELATNGKSLREAFSGALVNFTHWVKWGDDWAANSYSGLACFLRHAAAICVKNAPIDLFIPVHIPNAAMCGLNVACMTGIAIQVKRRRHPTPRASCEIHAENILMFDGVENKLPYITLVLELGVFEEHKPHDLRGGEFHVVSPPHRRNKTEACNPRYAITLYGCSPALYKVISVGDEAPLRALLQDRDVLHDHPRQDGDTLSIVKNQKPFFTVKQGLFSSWLDKEVVGPMNTVQNTHQCR